jgi:hypothetical protein
MPTRQMGLEHTIIRMGLFTRGSGWTISSMGEVLKAGQMGVNTPVTMSLARRRASDASTGRMDPGTMANSSATTSKVTARTAGRKAARTPAHGRKTKCTVRAPSAGPTDEPMSGPTKKTKRTVTACLSGRMGGGTKDVGRLGNNTGKGSLLRLDILERKGNGMKGSECYLWNN